MKTTLTEELRPYESELVRIRHDLHRHPELAFEEHRTSALVAERLAAWGIAVTRGIGGTGLVGTLRAGTGSRAIGIRADMDALPIQEAGGKPYASVHAGVMHACGHDGHVAMLLGAARRLAERRDFDGTVHFIFQPAEEKDAGADKMVRDGLFERFPMDAVYAMHNQPDMALGAIAVRPGPVMAGTVTFDITFEGVGAHAARPHKGIDPIVIAAQFVLSLQSIVSRNVDPLESAVVTVGVIRAGEVHNVIPQTASLSGTMRYFTPAVRDILQARIAELARHTALAFGGGAHVDIRDGYPPTTNHARETGHCRAAALALLGPQGLVEDKPPSMGAEDFAYMLRERPGCYVYIGNGPGEGGCLLHNPGFDFNDANIVTGAAFWTMLVRQQLPAA